MSSCFGMRNKRGSDDHEPLLPVYHDDTVLQRKLHQKLHSYQMVRALSKGFMPTTEQLIINLRTLLASDVLNPDEYSVSDSGRLLAKYSRQFLKQFIDTLQHKNGENQIQDFIWLLAHSRVTLDVGDLGTRARKAKNKAQIAGAYESIRTVLGFLLTNSDFRVFVADLQTIGRQVFRDFAGSVERVADNAGKQVDQTGTDVSQRLASSQAATTSGSDDATSNDSTLTAVKRTDEAPAPTQKDLLQNVGEVTSVMGEGAVQVAKDTKDSVQDHFSGEEKELMLSRLKKSIGKLRYQKDYTDSVSTLSLLIQRYAMAYSRAVEETVQATQEDLHANDEMDGAVHNFWSLVKSFGNPEEWDKLESSFGKVTEHRKSNPDFERVMIEIGNMAQKLLTDPEAWNDIDRRISDLQNSSEVFKSDASLGDDVRAVLNQTRRTYDSVRDDKDVQNLWNTVLRIVHIVSPKHSAVNEDLYYDCINVFGPLLVQAVQYIPIPRLEISVPEVDLLLENLILEPGKTVNNSSFLPFRLRFESENDVEIRKARTRVASTVTSLLTIKLDGMSVRADEIGFWLKAHSGLLRLADEGIASFRMDERGMDIHLDVEIGADRLEKILSLKAVRVKIHKLSYDLRKSRFSWLAWLVKPLLRPIIRKVMEKQLANAIADFFHAANRELLFARERLRATRIADPQDVMTFFKAVLTRLTPEPDPDVYARVGVAQPGEGVFKGVYAPGSVVKVWNEEAAKAPEVVEDFDRGAWRNDIFDIIQ